MRKLVVSLMVVAGLVAAAAPAMAGPADELTAYLGLPDVVGPDVDPNVDGITIPPSCLGTEATAGVCFGGTVPVSDHTVGDCIYILSTGCVPVTVTVPLPDGVYVGCSGWVNVDDTQFYCVRGIKLP